MQELASPGTLFCMLAVMLGACLQGAVGIGFALFAAPIVVLVQPDLVPGPMLVVGGAVSLLAALREWRRIDVRFAMIAFAGRVPGSILAGHPVGGVILMIALSAASAMLAFFSSAVLLPAALQTWSEPVCAGLLWLGWIVGGAVAYVIAKYLGRPALQVLTSSRALGRYETVITTRTPFGLVLLFQLAVPPAMVKVSPASPCGVTPWMAMETGMPSAPDLPT